MYKMRLILDLLPVLSGLKVKMDMYDYFFTFVPAEGARITDSLPEELREVTPAVWFSYPPQHPIIIKAVGLLYILCWLVCAIGNIMVIFVFIASKTLRTPTNMFVVNLAFSDLCMMTSMGLPVTINSFLADHWIWGSFLCKIYGCLGALFGTTSLVTMVVIGYDRFNVIVKGLRGTKMTRAKVVAIILAIWLYSLAGCLPPFVGWGGFALDGLLITCNYDYYTTDWNRLSYCLYALINHYIVPMILVMYFYSQIVKAVVLHERALKKQAEKMNVKSLRSLNDSASNTEIKVAKVAITNVLLWAITWTPFTAICVMALCGQLHLITPLVSQLPVFFAKMASCFNPVIFALSHPKYREALGQYFSCCQVTKEDGAEDREMKTMTEYP